MRPLLSPFDRAVVVALVVVAIIVAGFALDRSAHHAVCGKLGLLMNCGEGR